MKNLGNGAPGGGGHAAHAVLAGISLCTFLSTIVSTSLSHWLIIKIPTRPTTSLTLGVFSICDDGRCDAVRYSRITCDALVRQLEAAGSMSILSLATQLALVIPLVLLWARAQSLLPYLRPWYLPVVAGIAWVWLLTSWALIARLYHDPVCGAATFGGSLTNVYYGISFQMRVVEWLNVTCLVVTLLWLRWRRES